MLIQSLVEKQCLTKTEAEEILNRKYVDIHALEATLNFDYCVNPSAWSSKQLTNLG